MPGIRPISWKKFDSFLVFIGCDCVREKGDHRIYTRKDLKRPVVLPRDMQLPVFVIRNNLRILGITPEEYLRILEKI